MAALRIGQDRDPRWLWHLLQLHDESGAVPAGQQSAMGNASTPSSPTPDAPPITWDNPFPSAAAGAPPPPNYGYLTNDFGVGYSQLRSLHLSQQIGNNDAIEIGYSGNLALGGDRAVNANDAPPGPGAIQPRRRFPQYGVVTEVRSDAKTFYNAGTLKYTRRFSDGLTILSSYTFSRSIDQAFSSVAGNPTGGAVSQTYSNLSQRGLSSSHRKHVWTTSAVYELPFGKGRKFLNQGGVAELCARRLATEHDSHRSNPAAHSPSPCRAERARVNTGSDQRPNRLRDAQSSELRAQHQPLVRYRRVCRRARLYTFGSRRNPDADHAGTGERRREYQESLPVLREGINLEFRAEFFNFLNHTNFQQPGSVLGTPQFRHHLLGRAGAREPDESEASILKTRRTLLRIAIASMLQESNTFSPVYTRYEDFSPVFGKAVLERHRGKLTEMGGFLDVLDHARSRLRRYAPRGPSPPTGWCVQISRSSSASSRKASGKRVRTRCCWRCTGHRRPKAKMTSKATFLSIARKGAGTGPAHRDVAGPACQHHPAHGGLADAHRRLSHLPSRRHVRNRPEGRAAHAAHSERRVQARDGVSQAAADHSAGELADVSRSDVQADSQRAGAGASGKAEAVSIFPGPAVDGHRGDGLRRGGRDQWRCSAPRRSMPMLWQHGCGTTRRHMK